MAHPPCNEELILLFLIFKCLCLIIEAALGSCLVVVDGYIPYNASFISGAGTTAGKPQI
jgi:hypothetical protein